MKMQKGHIFEVIFWGMLIVGVASLVIFSDRPVRASVPYESEYWREAPPRPDGATCWKLYVRHHGFMGVSCKE